MSEQSILNVFAWVETPSLTDEQKRDVAKLLQAYLQSRDFSELVKRTASK